MIINVRQVDKLDFVIENLFDLFNLFATQIVVIESQGLSQITTQTV